MEHIMDVEPGLLIWTLINFLIFLAILVKLGTKPILKALAAREDSIKNNIENAEKASAQAQQILLESQTKLSQAQQEMNAIISKGKQQAEEVIRRAAEDAEKIKRQKVEDAAKEIERSKENAVKQLRTEVADLVVQATEKILGESLDKEKHYKIVEQYIEKLPKN